MKVIRRLIRSIAELGSDCTPARHHHRLGVLNVMTVASMVTCLVYLPYLWFIAQSQRLSVFTLSTLALFAVILTLSSRGVFTLARFIYLSGANAVVFIYACLIGPEAQIQAFTYALAGVAFLVVSTREKWLLGFGLILAPVSWLVAELTNYALLGAPQVDVVTATELSAFIVPTALVLLTVQLYYFAHSSQKTEMVLERRNAQMRLVLDNVEQGFLTLENDGTLLEERSNALWRWFGNPVSTEVTGYFEGISADFARWFELGWQQMQAGFMPVRAAIEQMPHRFSAKAGTFQVNYLPVGPNHDAPERFLLIISDITADLAAEQAEQEQRELLSLFAKVVRDPRGFDHFMQDARALVREIVEVSDERARDLRLVHTLAGNCGIYGAHTVASVCY